MLDFMIQFMIQKKKAVSEMSKKPNKNTLKNPVSWFDPSQSHQ